MRSRCSTLDATGRLFSNGMASNRRASPRSVGCDAPPAAPCVMSDTVVPRVFFLQLDSDSRTRKIRAHSSVFRLDEAIEEHRLDPRMIKKIFEVSQGKERTAEMRV